MKKSKKYIDPNTKEAAAAFDKAAKSFIKKYASTKRKAVSTLKRLGLIKLLTKEK